MMKPIRILVFMVASGIALPIAWGQAETIKIGYLAQVHDGPLLVAAGQLAGAYKIEYVKFFRYTDAEIALSKNDIQISSLGYVSAITSAARGRDAAFTFVVGQSRGAINLVCRAGVKIETWSDLSGKTIGVLTGGTAEIFFDDALATHNVSVDTLKKLPFPVPGPPLLQALKEKAMDCMAVYEPFAASAVSDGYGYYPPLDLGDNSFLGVNGGVAVNRAFLSANRDFVEKLVKDVVKAVDDLPTRKNEWTDVVVDKTGFKTQTVLLGMDHLKLDWHLYDGRVNTLAGAVASLGLVRRRPSPEAIKAYFDDDLLSKVTGQPSVGSGKSP